MTEDDKREIIEIFTRIIDRRENSCPLGIYPETAHDLISFAAAWRNVRKTALVTFITVIVTALLAALAAGIRAAACIRAGAP